MLDADTLVQLKKKYGRLFTVTVKGFDIVFKELTFAEYDEIYSYQVSPDFSSAEAEDIILQYAIVYPQNFDIYKIPAGAVSELASEIINFSGFASARIAKQTVEAEREQANEVRNLMKAFIMATMSSYTEEDLDQLTFSEMAKKLALAEKIIEIKQSINGLQASNIHLEFIDPEEEAERERKLATNYNKSRKDGEASYDDPVARKLWNGM